MDTFLQIFFMVYILCALMVLHEMVDSFTNDKAYQARWTNNALPFGAKVLITTVVTVFLMVISPILYLLRAIRN